MGYELIAHTRSLAMSAIVKASALAPVAPFNLDGERVSGKDLGATDASPLRHQTERALSLQPSLLGHEPNICGLLSPRKRPDPLRWRRLVGR